MSGIAAIIRLDGREVRPGSLDAMADQMSHRGLDGVTTRASGSTGLVFLKRSTTPESVRETQPIVHSESGNVLVADIRLDGREDLAHSLDMDRSVVHTSAGPTDAELLMRAYLKWGDAVAEHIDGDFAFIVWNEKERTLFAARDRFAIRTLYYHHVPGQLLALASEAKGLLAIPEIPDRMDQVKLGHFLTGSRSAPDRSIFQAVKILPAAHALRWSDSTLRTWSYYELTPAKGLGSLTGQDGIDAFKEQFEKAVRDRVRSAFPVGADLSGGLDSSSIVAVARDAVTDQGLPPLHTFTLAFDETSQADETKYARAVIDQGGIQPHIVSADSASPLGNLNEVYSKLDDGLVGGTQHLAYALLCAARDAGARVVLDGFDGDNVVAHGERLMGEKAARGDWKSYAQMAQATAARYRQADHRQNFEEILTSYETIFKYHGWPALSDQASFGPRIQFLRSLYRARKYAGVDMPETLGLLWRRLLRSRSYNRRRRAAQNVDQSRGIPFFIDRGFAQRVGVELKHSVPFQTPDPGKTVTVRERQQEMLSSTHFLTALQSPTHIASSLGIELAHPFFDRRLMELCLALPPEQSFHDGWTRYVLRKAMDGRLPDSVAWRVGKAMLTPTFERAFELHDRERLADLAQNPGWMADYLDMDAFRDFAAEGRTLTEKEETMLAWIATAMIWLNKQWPAGPDGPSIYGQAG